jgi:hypothetical protein
MKPKQQGVTPVPKASKPSTTTPATPAVNPPQQPPSAQPPSGPKVKNPQYLIPMPKHPSAINPNHTRVTISASKISTKPTKSPQIRPATASSNPTWKVETTAQEKALRRPQSASTTAGGVSRVSRAVRNGPSLEKSKERFAHPPDKRHYFHERSYEDDGNFGTVVHEYIDQPDPYPTRPFQCR